MSTASTLAAPLGQRTSTSALAASLSPRASTLAELPVGSNAIISSLPTGRPALTRLRELGLVPGTLVRIIRRAPLGEPIEIALRGSHISMRNHEAAFIEISPMGA